jgi:hypothetical protein
MKIRHIDVRVQDLNFDYFLDELVAGVLEKGSQVQDSFREREIMAQLVFTQGFLAIRTAETLSASSTDWQIMGRSQTLLLPLLYLSNPGRACRQNAESFRRPRLPASRCAWTGAGKMIDDLREAFEDHRSTSGEESQELPM